MVCLYCGTKTKIINSRLKRRSNLTWRRRKCPRCQAVFTTREQIDFDQSLLVKDSLNQSTAFLEEKLYLSIYESLRHRPSAIVEAKHLTQTVIDKIIKLNQSVIEASFIADTTTVVLNRFDKTASTHYRAYHT